MGHDIRELKKVDIFMLIRRCCLQQNGVTSRNNIFHRTFCGFTIVLYLSNRDLEIIEVPPKCTNPSPLS